MLLIDHNTTSGEVKYWIQDRLYNFDMFSIQQFLNSNLQAGYNEVLWDEIMNHDFAINYNNRIVSCNTLLHVGVYVKVTPETMSSLLNIGMDHYAFLHVNSDGCTPTELASILDDEYDLLSNHMSNWVSSHTIEPIINERLQAVFSNANNLRIDKSYDRDGNTEYVVTLDLLPVLAIRGYSLFNHAYTVHEEIQEFINNRIESHDGKLDNDAITVSVKDTRVIFSSDNEDTLKILLCGAVNEEEYVER